MTDRESDHCIVPSNPGNAGRGKAVTPTRNSNDPSTIRSDGRAPKSEPSVQDRLGYIHQRALSQPQATFANVFHLLKFKLLELLRIRITDRRMLRLVTRFLKAGVMIDGDWWRTTKGVPQGSVLSPILANVYLHYVLDQWLERDVKPRLTGEAYVVRYADDFICSFQNHDDAIGFQNVLVKRLKRFELGLAQEKSKLLRFGRFAERDCREMNEGKPGVFDFLGFTHYCGRSRAGKFKLKRKTAKKKFRQKLLAMKSWLRANLTTPADELWQTLNRKLRGHYQYYGVSDNWDYLLSYREKVTELVCRWMGRRSQRSMSKTDFYKQYLPRHPLARPRRLTNLFV